MEVLKYLGDGKQGVWIKLMEYNVLGFKIEKSREGQVIKKFMSYDENFEFYFKINRRNWIVVSSRIQFNFFL